MWGRSPHIWHIKGFIVFCTIFPTIHVHGSRGSKTICGPDPPDFSRGRGSLLTAQPPLTALPAPQSQYMLLLYDSPSVPFTISDTVRTFGDWIGSSSDTVRVVSHSSSNGLICGTPFLSHRITSHSPSHLLRITASLAVPSTAPSPLHTAARSTRHILSCGHHELLPR